MTRLFEKVLFATDLSQGSEKVFLNLTGMAGLGIKEVLLLYVMSKEFTEEGISARDQAEGELSGKAEHLKGLGMRPEYLIRVGDPAEVILSEAGEWGATLILMGSKPHGLIKDLLVGATEDEVLRHARVPVLFFPEG